MELFNRLDRIIKTNIDQLLIQATSPEEVLEQTVDEIEQTLLQTKQAIARIDSVPNKKAQLNYSAAVIEASKWRTKVQIARSNNDEHSENYALERLKIHENNALEAKAQMHQYTDRVESLKRHLTILERKLVEVKSKKDLYKAQVSAADAPKKTQDVISTFNFAGESDSFSKIVLDVSQKPKDLALVEKAIQNMHQILNSEINSQSEIRNEYLYAKLKVKNSNKQPLEISLRIEPILEIQNLIEQIAYQKLANIYEPQISKLTKRIELLEENLAVLEEVRDIIQEFAKFENSEESKLETYDLYDPAIDAELEELQAQLKNM